MNRCLQRQIEGSYCKGQRGGTASREGRSKREGQKFWEECLESMKAQLLTHDISGSAEASGLQAGDKTKFHTPVDAFKVFNDIYCQTIHWAARHYWSEGKRFVLKCYRNKVLFAVYQPLEVYSFITSREGFTQGVLLSISLYVFSLLPLDESMWQE